MPEQQFVLKLFFSGFSMIYIPSDCNAHEFTVFKPDKKLKWLPHLGTVQLELQLEDRVVDVDVPPLEAAFIELFSEKGLSTPRLFFCFNCERLVLPYPLAVWTLEDLISSVGSIDRGATIKALSRTNSRASFCFTHGPFKFRQESSFVRYLVFVHVSRQAEDE